MGGQLPAWRSVLAVVAHPDDESFGLGAILSAFADRGAELAVLCLTQGEASTLHGVAGELGDIRARELKAAAAELGVYPAHPRRGRPEHRVRHGVPRTSTRRHRPNRAGGSTPAVPGSRPSPKPGAANERAVATPGTARSARALALAASHGQLTSGRFSPRRHGVRLISPTRRARPAPKSPATPRKGYRETAGSSPAGRRRQPPRGWTQPASASGRTPACRADHAKPAPCR